MNKGLGVNVMICNRPYDEAVMVNACSITLTQPLKSAHGYLRKK